MPNSCNTLIEHPTSNQTHTNTLPILGILGGMGPLAGLHFMQYLIQHTPATCDQMHLPTLLYSLPSIPDRTLAILGQGPSPFLSMRLGLEQLEAAGATYFAMPCNTAHQWFDALQRSTRMRGISILHSVAQSLNAQRVHRVGLLATTGTYHAELYPKALSQWGIECVIPNQALQRDIMALIYLVKSGNLLAAQAGFKSLAENKAFRHSEALILGCSELALAKPDHMHSTSPILDASELLAKACIQTCYAPTVTASNL